jgi:alpha-beta hydrolase superfamily lysophospholipase
MIRWRATVSTIALALAAGLAAPMAREPPKPTPIAAPAPDLIFTMPDGFVLPARQWLPPAGTPWRGVILALHGFSDSRDAWEYPAPGFAADGYAVFAPDQRGFGATADRGSWAGTQTMVDDAATIAATLRARYPTQRLILMGESMGGAVALCLAARPAHTADATILLAPAVWGRAQMGAGLSAALAIANSVAPSWVLSGSQVPRDITASDNREALLALFNDPLTQRASSVHTLYGLVNLMDAAQAAAPALHGPVLILDGRRDQVIPPPATAALWAKLPPGVRRAFYLSGYHLLLRDHDRALVEADILSWLDTPESWLPSGADTNAAAWQSDHAWSRDNAPLPAKLLDGTGLRRVWPY